MAAELAAEDGPSAEPVKPRHGGVVAAGGENRAHCHRRRRPAMRCRMHRSGTAARAQRAVTAARSTAGLLRPHHGGQCRATRHRTPHSGGGCRRRRSGGGGGSGVGQAPRACQLVHPSAGGATASTTAAHSSMSNKRVRQVSYAVPFLHNCKAVAVRSDGSAHAGLCSDQARPFLSFGQSLASTPHAASSPSSVISFNSAVTPFEPTGVSAYLCQMRASLGTGICFIKTEPYVYICFIKTGTNDGLRSSS